MTSSTHPSAEALAAARHQFFEQHQTPGTLISPLIERSWQRSLKSGLTPGHCSRDARLSQPEFRHIRERNRTLLDIARPQLESLFEQIQDTQCAVLLADQTGTILHGVGDAAFVPEARRVELMPGGVWSEGARGTNAIGTAASEGRSVVVHGQEHFLDQNGFLTCAAVPVFDPGGQVIGVLDISSDARHSQRHTMALVNLAVSMIENSLLERTCERAHLMYLHPHAHLLGGLYEGIIAYDDNGHIIGANRWARHHLNVTDSTEQPLNLRTLFPRLTEPEAHASLVTQSGQTLHARHKAYRAPTRPTRPAPATPVSATKDPLAALDSTDPDIAKLITQARRIVGQGIPIVLQGETGVGKDVWARALHQAGPRSGAMVAVNCAAIPETLIEAELFGYRPGAFTGADKAGSRGRILDADNGTLFLDEIGDMPRSLQSRLLRVLQERQVTPVGGGQPIPVDCDLICATHARLREAVSQGVFRQDLYYRINGLTLNLPPLRSRSDIRALIDQVLADLGGGTLSQASYRLMIQHPWPGNLRQLHSVLRTARILCGPDESITPEHLSADFLAEARVESNGAALADWEQFAINTAMTDNQGNVSAAARQLNIDRSTLHRKLRLLSGK
ncbi:sigma-54-dependent Fis family transcriptional regulator [Saccharospirillum impatiens]|uniref:sigma-54-dependent Fis family transcriptional regulator n=1 Tax=Saccharospirillum impatiens TaxID=169438 RepID=UPI00040C5CA9|nr:sigma-54-dependent Fis family transcriptional regulator [Saccharospirillum impatiens]